MARSSWILAISLLGGCTMGATPGPAGPRQAPSPLLSQVPLDPGAAAASPEPAAPVTPPPASTSSVTPGIAIGLVTLTTVVITNSGTAASTGFRILVTPQGEATYQTPSGEGSQQLPVVLTQSLFGDLAAAKPLSSLPAGPCGQSPARASLYVSLGGQQTPDLSCPTGEFTQAIAEDVQKVVEYLGITVRPATPGQPNVPVMNF